MTKTKIPNSPPWNSLLLTPSYASEDMIALLIESCLKGFIMNVGWKGIGGFRVEHITEIAF